MEDKQENQKRIPYQYRVNDKVLLDITGTTKAKYANNPYFKEKFDSTHDGPMFAEVNSSMFDLLK